MDLERHNVGLGNIPALIVVDMIKGFTSTECPLGSDCPQVVAATRRLLDAFRDLSLPVFYTTVVYRDDGQARVFRQRIPALNVLQPGSPWVELDPALDRRADEVIIEKRWASAFFDTELQKLLKSRQVDSVVVTGLTTSGCVRATVLDAMQYDYPVVVAREAVGDRNNEAHEANLHDMNAKYADVVPLETVIHHLEQLPVARS